MSEFKEVLRDLCMVVVYAQVFMVAGLVAFGPWVWLFCWLEGSCK